MDATLAGLVLTVDAVVSAVAGAILFFAPHTVGDFLFNRTTDGIHWHLIRCIGGQILALAFIFQRLGRRSAETRTTCFLLRLVSAILSIYLFYHARATGLVRTEVAESVIYVGYTAIASCLLFLLWSGWPLGKDLYNSPVENVLYQLDSLASVTIGMAWISQPKWLLHRQVNVKMDASHEFCGRAMGAMFVCSQVLAMHALYWRDRADRLLAAEARAFCCACILIAQIWSQIAYGKDWGHGHWVGISLFSTWTVIAISYRIAIYFFDPAKTSKSLKSPYKPKAKQSTKSE